MALLLSLKRTVNLEPGLTTPQVFHVSQNDVGTKLYVGLEQGGTAYTIPDGTTAKVQGCNALGEPFEAITATVSASEVYFTISDQDVTQFAGKAVCEVVLTNGGNILGTANFIVMVEASPMGSDVPAIYTNPVQAYIEGVVQDYVDDDILPDITTAINGKADASDVGDLTELETTDKTSIVGAVNELTSGKVDINQGTTHSGKALVVNASGNVEPVDVLASIREETQLHPYGIEPFQTSLFKPTVNIFSDFCYHVTKAYYRDSIDATKPYPRVSPTQSYQGWLIRVKPNTTYAIGPIDFRLEFLSYNGDLDIRVSEFSNTEPNIITSGSKSYWMCLTQLLTRDMSEWMMVEDDTYPSEYVSGYPEWAYEPKSETLSGLQDDMEDMQSSVSAIENELLLHPYGIEPFQLSLFKHKENLFSDFCYHITGGYYRERTASSPVGRPRITATPNWQGWLIHVKPNTTYTLGPLDFKLELIDSEFNPDITISDISDSEPNTITTGENSLWMCLTQRSSKDMSGWMMVEGDTYPSEYVSGRPQWIEEPQSPITDKTIAFFGDSITAGSGVTGQPDSQCYHQYIHDRYGYTCLNYAYGGSGYVKSYTGTTGLHGTGAPGRGVSNRDGFSPNNVRTRLAEVDPATLDAVVIFAGTNDWSNAVSLSDFATELDTVFDYYQNNFGSVPLLVMTPIHRINDTTPDGRQLIDYVNIIIQKCKEHGVPYVDTFSASGLQPNNTGNRAVFFPRDDSGNDGIHPNHLAHQRLARAIGETLNQLVLWNTDAKR